jgi:hypothetical protein
MKNRTFLYIIFKTFLKDIPTVMFTMVTLEKVRDMDTELTIMEVKVQGQPVFILENGLIHDIS